MTAALCFTASYAVLGERDAALAGDDPDETPRAAAGEDLGTFTLHTPWPILIACCVLAGLAGALWSPFLAVASVAGLVFCLWRLGAESAIAPSGGR